MSSIMRTITIGLAVLIFLSTAGIYLAADKPAEPSECCGYQSPSEVFNAFRAAAEKKDCRVYFNCLTPETQKAKIYSAFVYCIGTLNNEKIVATLKKYHVTNDEVNADYMKRYEAKHSVDLGKKEAGAINKATASASLNENSNTPPDADVDNEQKTVKLDWELLRDVLFSRIEDKAGFIEAVFSVVGDRGCYFSELKYVSIQGDIAKGLAQFCIDPLEKKAEEKTGPVITYIIHFRKTENGWHVADLDQFNLANTISIIKGVSNMFSRL
jgi:hypothetical protein